MRKISRMCRFKLTSLSDCPESDNRFCVPNRTPMPALEMYSRLVKSTVHDVVTVLSWSRTFSTCDASRRPESKISPLVPLRTSNIHAPLKCFTSLMRASPSVWW
jgi:hypothetical protein